MPSWTEGRPIDRGDGGRKVLRPLRVSGSLGRRHPHPHEETGARRIAPPSSLARRVTGSGPYTARISGCSPRDRKSTRLNSSHGYISYAVFCLKKKKRNNAAEPTEYPQIAALTHGS